MHFDIACALHTHRFVFSVVLQVLSFSLHYIFKLPNLLLCLIFCSARSSALPDLLVWIILFCEVYSRQYIFFIDRVCFDVQVFVYTCAPLSDEFETTDSKPGFGHQNQFCVVLRSVLFLQKTLSNGDDDRIGFFDFFTIEKREPLQHVFLYVAPQSTINRVSTSTPRSTLYYHFIQTPLLCQHYISMPHTHQYRKHITLLRSTINPINRYPSYTKLSFYATSFPRRFHATPTTLKRCTSATILPVSSQLDLRFNSTELSKIIVRAVLLSQLNCIFLNHQP